ncbi:hypothetical protein AYJ57_25270 (plasmid) [Salipiger sp. CCB-MM3]|nr:hypothetical protein AYJ57_25270 [Salipiger sp. CCB-MM3]
MVVIGSSEMKAMTEFLVETIEMFYSEAEAQIQFLETAALTICQETKDRIFLLEAEGMTG